MYGISLVYKVFCRIHWFYFYWLCSLTLLDRAERALRARCSVHGPASRQAHVATSGRMLVSCYLQSSIGTVLR